MIKVIYYHVLRAEIIPIEPDAVCTVEGRANRKIDFKFGFRDLLLTEKKIFFLFLLEPLWIPIPPILVPFLRAITKKGAFIMVTVNGQEEDVAGQTVIDFLKKRNVPIENIVVERNGDIVHRAQFDKVKLESGDKVELISFVGGG